MSTEQIRTMAQRRAGAEAERRSPRKRKVRRAANEAGGLHAIERETATINESARQLDTATDVERDNFPSTWKRATALEAPPPRPGHTQRWVRRRLNGQDDTENYHRYLEEGWRPRKLSTIPRSHLLTSTRPDKNAQEYVKRGHVLMELPDELVRQRNAEYQGSLDRQHRAMENELYKDNTGQAARVMPLTDATIQSRAALARRRPRTPAADE